MDDPFDSKPFSHRGHRELQKQQRSGFGFPL
jgi:hypothetical protein